jgi:hypothetical protein
MIDVDGKGCLTVIMAWAPGLELIFATCLEARESPESIKSGNSHHKLLVYGFLHAFDKNI